MENKLLEIVGVHDGISFGRNDQEIFLHLLRLELEKLGVAKSSVKHIVDIFDKLICWEESRCVIDSFNGYADKANYKSFIRHIDAVHVAIVQVSNDW